MYKQKIDAKLFVLNKNISDPLDVYKQIIDNE